MLGLYLLGQNCLPHTFEQYLSSETYSRKYEKLPNRVILACKNITEKMHLLKMSGPQIWLCLFTFYVYVLFTLFTLVRLRMRENTGSKFLRSYFSVKLNSCSEDNIVKVICMCT